MPRRGVNSQMFALDSPPPRQIELAGTAYRLLRVFKHDFWAATCLYEPASGTSKPKAVVKFSRTQPFLGLPTSWIGRMLASREEGAYAALAGVEGVPRWLGRLGESSYAVQFIEGRPLDHVKTPPAGFFDRLRRVFDAIHARGVAYGDANKRSNIIIAEDGAAFLVDYQLTFRRRDNLPWPMNAISRALFKYIAGRDLYHLYKHKRRMAPNETTESEAAISRTRGPLHNLHRKLTDPYRFLRRRLLRRWHRKGTLVSPTEDLEDHWQPEKRTWREERK